MINNLLKNWVINQQLKEGLGVLACIIKINK